MKLKHRLLSWGLALTMAATSISGLSLNAFAAGGGADVGASIPDTYAAGEWSGIASSTQPLIHVYLIDSDIRDGTEDDDATHYSEVHDYMQELSNGIYTKVDDWRAIKNSVWVFPNGAATNEFGLLTRYEAGWKGSSSYSTDKYNVVTSLSGELADIFSGISFSMDYTTFSTNIGNAINSNYAAYRQSTGGDADKEYEEIIEPLFQYSDSETKAYVEELYKSGKPITIAMELYIPVKRVSEGKIYYISQRGVLSYLESKSGSVRPYTKLASGALMPLTADAIEASPLYGCVPFYKGLGDCWYPQYAEDYTNVSNTESFLGAGGCGWAYYSFCAGESTPAIDLEVAKQLEVELPEDFEAPADFSSEADFIDDFFDAENKITLTTTYKFSDTFTNVDVGYDASAADVMSEVVNEIGDAQINANNMMSAVVRKYGGGSYSFGNKIKGATEYGSTNNDRTATELGVIDIPNDEDVTAVYIAVAETSCKVTGATAKFNFKPAGILKYDIEAEEWSIASLSDYSDINGHCAMLLDDRNTDAEKVTVIAQNYAKVQSTTNTETDTTSTDIVADAVVVEVDQYYMNNIPEDYGYSDSKGPSKVNDELMPETPEDNALHMYTYYGITTADAKMTVAFSKEKETSINADIDNILANIEEDETTLAAPVEDATYEKLGDKYAFKMNLINEIAEFTVGDKALRDYDYSLDIKTLVDEGFESFYSEDMATITVNGEEVTLKVGGTYAFESYTEDEKDTDLSAIEDVLLEYSEYARDYAAYEALVAESASSATVAVGAMSDEAIAAWNSIVNAVNSYQKLEFTPVKSSCTHYFADITPAQKKEHKCGGQHCGVCAGFTYTIFNEGFIKPAPSGGPGYYEGSQFTDFTEKGREHAKEVSDVINEDIKIFEALTGWDVVVRLPYDEWKGVSPIDHTGCGPNMTTGYRDPTLCAATEQCSHTSYCSGCSTRLDGTKYCSGHTDTYANCNGNNEEHPYELGYFGGCTATHAVPWFVGDSAALADAYGIEEGMSPWESSGQLGEDFSVSMEGFDGNTSDHNQGNHIGGGKFDSYEKKEKDFFSADGYLDGDNASPSKSVKFKQGSGTILDIANIAAPDAEANTGEYISALAIENDFLAIAGQYGYGGVTKIGGHIGTMIVRMIEQVNLASELEKGRPNAEFVVEEMYVTPYNEAWFKTSNPEPYMIAQLWQKSDHFLNSNTDHYLRTLLDWEGTADVVGDINPSRAEFDNNKYFVALQKYANSANAPANAAFNQEYIVRDIDGNETAVQKDIYRWSYYSPAPTKYADLTTNAFDHFNLKTEGTSTTENAKTTANETYLLARTSVKTDRTSISFDSPIASSALDAYYIVAPNFKSWTSIWRLDDSNPTNTYLPTEEWLNAIEATINMGFGSDSFKKTVAGTKYVLSEDAFEAETSNEGKAGGANTVKANDYVSTYNADTYEVNNVELGVLNTVGSTNLKAVYVGGFSPLSVEETAMADIASALNSLMDEARDLGLDIGTITADDLKNLGVTFSSRTEAALKTSDLAVVKSGWYSADIPFNLITEFTRRHADGGHQYEEGKYDEGGSVGETETMDGLELGSGVYQREEDEFYVYPLVRVAYYKPIGTPGGTDDKEIPDNTPIENADGGYAFILGDEKRTIPSLVAYNVGFIGTAQPTVSATAVATGAKATQLANKFMTETTDGTVATNASSDKKIPVAYSGTDINVSYGTTDLVYAIQTFNLINLEADKSYQSKWGNKTSGTAQGDILTALGAKQVETDNGVKLTAIPYQARVNMGLVNPGSVNQYKNAIWQLQQSGTQAMYETKTALTAQADIRISVEKGQLVKLIIPAKVAMANVIETHEGKTVGAHSNGFYSKNGGNNYLADNLGAVSSNASQTIIPTVVGSDVIIEGADTQALLAKLKEAGYYALADAIIRMGITGDAHDMLHQISETYYDVATEKTVIEPINDVKINEVGNSTGGYNEYITCLAIRYECSTYRPSNLAFTDKVAVDMGPATQADQNKYFSNGYGLFAERLIFKVGAQTDVATTKATKIGLTDLVNNAWSIKRFAGINCVVGNAAMNTGNTTNHILGIAAANGSGTIATPFADIILSDVASTNA